MFCIKVKERKATVLHVWVDWLWIAASADRASRLFLTYNHQDLLPKSEQVDKDETKLAC